MNAIEFTNVSKKFKKGENHDSLRDLVPSLVKKAMPWGNNKNTSELHGQEFWAVKDVSFELKKGEALGIIGPNGAGKSTILKLLSRILRPTKGEIKINGRLSALIEVGAGFHPDLTGRENIYLSGAVMGMKKSEINSKLDSIVEFSGIDSFIDTPVKRYSSGMYVRLGFSVAVHMDPEILLIDEVLAVGDISFQAKCIQKIHKIINSGITIIFISHNLETVRRLCPKAIFMNHGNISFIGKSQQAIERYLKISPTAAIDKKANLMFVDNTKMAKIDDIKLCDNRGGIKNEFRTGDYMKIEITYSTLTKIYKPTFTVGFFSNELRYTDHNSRFEGNDVDYVDKTGKADLIINNLLLLPGFYEAKIYFTDKEAMEHYDVKSVYFFVKEGKRGDGLYYQPHSWKIGVCTV
jgi:lipopolysaccharide transport system ATP-binding protein